MGVVDDYINSLEGRENLDPVEIASDLARLHSDEIGVFSAKISDLEEIITSKDQTINDVSAEVNKYKAQNYDLAMQIPGALSGHDDAGNTNTEITGATITPDDLFK